MPLKVVFQTCIDLAQDYSKSGITYSLDFVRAWHLWSHVLPVHNLFMEPWYCPVWFLSTLMIKRIFVGYLSTLPTGNSSHLGLTITPIAPLHLQALNYAMPNQLFRILRDSRRIPFHTACRPCRMYRYSNGFLHHWMQARKVLSSNPRYQITLVAMLTNLLPISAWSL